MHKFICFTLLAASFMVAACAPAANNSSANKPANAGNTANASNSTAANPAAIETEIKKAVTDMATALQNNDAAYSEKLYTENYMFVAPDGSVATGPERITSMKSGQTKYDAIKYEDVSVRSNPEGNGAISISRATVKGLNLGRPVDGHYRVTHVWSKTKDGWRLANGQATPITASSADANKMATNANTAAPVVNSTANANK